jgi:transposase
MTDLTERRKQMEERRLKAIPLFEKGIHRAEVARRLKVSRKTVTLWWRAWQEGSDLKGRKPPGRPLNL